MRFDMTVVSYVNYKMVDGTGRFLTVATIDAPCTATMTNASTGIERLKIAHKGPSLRAFDNSSTNRKT